jgi:hypothetical protein
MMNILTYKVSTVRGQGQSNAASCASTMPAPREVYRRALGARKDVQICVPTATTTATAALMTAPMTAALPAAIP